MSNETRKFWLEYIAAQPSYAVSIVNAIAASMPLATLLREDEKQPTPRQIASFACDVAQALLDEMIAREWARAVEKPKT